MNSLNTVFEEKALRPNGESGGNEWDEDGTMSGKGLESGHGMSLVSEMIDWVDKRENK